MPTFDSQRLWPAVVAVGVLGIGGFVYAAIGYVERTSDARDQAPWKSAQSLVDHQTGKVAAPACGTGTHRDRSLVRGYEQASGRP